MGFPSSVSGYRAVVFGLAVALCSMAVSADTIVLKNGHRISASNVIEVGDKIRYETSVGELSLPKSIVDHIEKGGGGPRGASAADNASNMAITPPAMDAAGGHGAENERAGIHDGAIC